MFTKTLTAGAVLTVLGTALLTAAPAHADPDAPGCTVLDATADHEHGLVVFDLTCDEARDVVVDATAWHGSAEDHEPIDEQRASKHVGAGERWSSVLSFATDTTPSTDMISAQVLSWVDQGDTRERPAILATVVG